VSPVGWRRHRKRQHDRRRRSPQRGKVIEVNPPGILIVDDNDDNRFTLSLFLEAEGLERIR
jgi:hypothetical protein